MWATPAAGDPGDMSVSTQPTDPAQETGARPTISGPAPAPPDAAAKTPDPAAPKVPDAAEAKIPDPGAGGGRLAALDVLRGLAILGTLLTNIWIFSAATSGPGQLLSSEGRPLADVVFGQLLNLTTDGKYIGLLTIMFGIGLEIQRQSAIRRGEAWPGTYPWRAGLLILDGLLNYIFIFQFDVLMGYGLTGLVVAFVMATSPRAQKIWMTVGIVAHLAFLTYLAQPLRAFTDSGQAETGGSRVPLSEPERRALADATGMSVAEVKKAAASGQLDGASLDTTASYWDMVVDRVTNFWAGRGEIPIMFTMGLGLFLVGAHLYRAGLFRPEGARLRKRVMLLAFGIGFPIDAALRTVFSDYGHMYTRYVTSAMVSFGVLAAIAAFYAHGRRPGWLGKPLQYVGRMALTCYILQNLICSVIFYDWGFGLANNTPDGWNTAVTMAVYAGVCAMLVTLSWAWLRRWPRGPVEWVWHSSHAAIVRRLPGALAPRARAAAAPSAPSVPAAPSAPSGITPGP